MGFEGAVTEESVSDLRAETHLATHDVANQPPVFENINLYTSDRALRAAVGPDLRNDPRLVGFGARCGSAQTAEWAMQANRHVPQLKTFDRYGRRLDEVEFHPAYHALMAMGIEAGISAAAWRGERHGHMRHAALEFLMTQAEPGVCCPMTMTYAALPALAHAPQIYAQWAPRILAASYDSSSQPAAQKRGVTIGMAMTEKQGGSDVRANTTRAAPMGDGLYHLFGHKWFCSAPMSDAFLTLAYAPGGLSCFLVPRWTESGARNAIYLMRLKDKLGDRANASAEIEYHGAEARLIGEEGAGVRTIIEMVHHTRLDCIIAPAAMMRQALANMLWHVSHRSAFQKKLIDQPLMRKVAADMVVESEAATALAFYIAHQFDMPGREAGLLSRIATPISKYWINKRVVPFVFEAMEAHGGAGYIEDSVMPRLFRQSPLNSIWEGSGNVICLDVLRALHKAPETAARLIAELEKARGTYTVLDQAIEAVKTTLHTGAVEEGAARHVVEQLALCMQASLLTQNAPAAVADAFCALRLAEPAVVYGAARATIDSAALISRASPE